ncbi:MAG: twin-arginine translocation signal domain-containing protein [Acidobacteria bacterium]|nr:twin-arginine translocation signal domain-containing protein [Acidobacteriota bacterium]
MKDEAVSRREALKLGAAAGVGAVITILNQSSSHAASSPINWSGSGSEYDKYDGVGLANLRCPCLCIGLPTDCQSV